MSFLCKMLPVARLLSDSQVCRSFQESEVPWVHSEHLIRLSSQVPSFLLFLSDMVTSEAGMLMRFPTEEDLTMRPPQTPPASMAPMPGFPL